MREILRTRPSGLNFCDWETLLPSSWPKLAPEHRKKKTSPNNKNPFSWRTPLSTKYAVLWNTPFKNLAVNTDLDILHRPAFGFFWWHWKGTAAVADVAFERGACKLLSLKQALKVTVPPLCRTWGSPSFFSWTSRTSNKRLHKLP